MKELGLWFMDISKYMVTALLLATVFSDMSEPVIFCVVAILSIVVLIVGFILVQNDKNKQNIKKGKRK